MSKVVVPEYLPDEFLARLRREHQVVYDPDMYSNRARLLVELDAAEAMLIRNRTMVDEELIEAALTMKVVGRLGVGLDNIDMDACSRAGWKVIPATGGNAVSVAEYVIGAMLVLTRGVFGMTPSMIAGDWPRQGHAFGHEVMGKTLGLVGFGAIAREVATRAAGFGMRVLAHDPFIPDDDPVWSAAGRVELDELLAEADVISVHVPLSPGTRDLIDGRALALMKPTSVLINTSRGGTVDETAVAGALRRGELTGAALDVFASEPLGPEPAAVFTGLPNLILTPHLAGNTREAVDRVAGMIVGEVLEQLGAESGSDLRGDGQRNGGDNHPSSIPPRDSRK